MEALKRNFENYENREILLVHGRNEQKMQMISREISKETTKTVVCVAARQTKEKNLNAVIIPPQNACSSLLVWLMV